MTDYTFQVKRAQSNSLEKAKVLTQNQVLAVNKELKTEPF